MERERTRESRSPTSFIYAHTWCGIKTMYPFHCYSVACAGINPWTLEDVCRMSLHKFRANCTCEYRRHTTPVLVVSQSRHFPFLSAFRLSHLSRHLRSSLISPSLLVGTQPLAGSRREGRYILPPSPSLSLSLRPREHSEIIARCNVQLFQCKPSSKRLIPELMYSPLFT